METVDGRVAVITTATLGMALPTAELFVAKGAYVFITGRRQEKPDEVVKAIGRNVTGVQGDASNLTDLDRLYQIVKKEKGKIDKLFASAGQGEFVMIEGVTEEHFDRLLRLMSAAPSSQFKKRFRYSTTVDRLCSTVRTRGRRYRRIRSLLRQ